MKSSKASTLKGLPNQIIKQIVKVVLPSDVVQLQPGRKPKKDGRKPKVGGKSKKPRGKAGKAGKDDGKLPKAPEGVLSHIIRPGKPVPPPPSLYPSVFGAPIARPFAQQTFQPPASSPYEKMYEKLLEKLKETPKGTEAVSAPSTVAPVLKPSVSLAQASQPASSIKGKSGEQIASEIMARSRSRSQMRNLPIHAEEIPTPAGSSRLLSPQPAPNQATQPAVDTTAEGKEAEVKPQQGARTFIQAQPQPSPSQPASASTDSSSSEVFTEKSRALSPQRIQNPRERLAVVKTELEELMKEKPSSKGRGAKAREEEWDRRKRPLQQEYNMLMKEVRKEELGAGGALVYWQGEVFGSSSSSEPKTKPMVVDSDED